MVKEMRFRICFFDVYITGSQRRFDQANTEICHIHFNTKVQLLQEKNSNNLFFPLLRKKGTTVRPLLSRHPRDLKTGSLIEVWYKLSRNGSQHDFIDHRAKCSLKNIHM